MTLTSATALARRDGFSAAYNSFTPSDDRIPSMDELLTDEDARSKMLEAFPDADEEFIAACVAAWASSYLETVRSMASAYADRMAQLDEE